MVVLQQHPYYAAAVNSIGGHAEIHGRSADSYVLLRRGPVAFLNRVAPTVQPPNHRGLLITNTEFGRPGGIRILRPKSAIELDLRAEPPLLRAAMHPKWRNRLVRAEKNPLVVDHHRFLPDCDHWLLRENRTAQQVRGFRSWPDRLTCAYAAQARDAAQIFVANDACGPVAAMLFLCHGFQATYHIGWSGARGRALKAHNLILWRAVLALRNQGIRSLELGIVSRDTSGGLARFKLGTGAILRRLGGTWVSVTCTGRTPDRAAEVRK